MMIKKLGFVMAMSLSLAACDDGFGGLGKDRDAAGAGGVGSQVFDENSIGYFNQTIGDRVLFPVDQSTLTPEALSILDAQANWLLSRPQFTVKVEGHADEQGTREYNLALGARRAAAVQNYLVSRGLSDARVQTVTYGKERPIEICSDEACWSKNRRAVTVVAGGFGS
jgi:peptidoglycan-associated lipoprotein